MIDSEAVGSPSNLAMISEERAKGYINIGDSRKSFIVAYPFFLMTFRMKDEEGKE